MRPSICIIDDDALYKLLLKKSINKLPFKVEISCYNNGEEALSGLQAIQAQNALLPDVILLDINMPVMDGWEFLDAFKTIKSQFSKTIKIYMASSSISINDFEKAKLYSEVSDYLVKPLNLSKIQELLTVKPNAALHSG